MRSKDVSGADHSHASEDAAHTLCNSPEWWQISRVQSSLKYCGEQRQSRCIPTRASAQRLTWEPMVVCHSCDLSHRQEWGVAIADVFA